MKALSIKPIHNEKDYEAALEAVSALIEDAPELGTPESDYLIVMSMLIEAYENEHYPIEAPDPIEAIKFRMEQQGLTTKDLESAIGRPNRVSEVLNRKRGLSLDMIRRLHKQFGIPLESLVGV